MFSNSIRLQVEPKNPDADPYTVGVTIKTMIAFEREYKTTMAAAFTGQMSIEHLAWVSWHATRMSGRVVKPFEEWVEHEIEDISIMEDEPDPLVEDTQPMR